MSEKFNWSKTDQGLLLSAYFYGYIFPNLFGGFLAQKFGGRIVIFLTMFLSAIITAISAFEVHIEESFIFIFTLRVLLGIFGVSHDNLQLVYNWYDNFIALTRDFSILRHIQLLLVGHLLKRKANL